MHSAEERSKLYYMDRQFPKLFLTHEAYMHTLEDSPAEGLVATFFGMAENRGFFILPEQEPKRAQLEWDLRAMIDGLIEEGLFEIPDTDGDLSGFLLKLRREPVARPPECRVLKMLRSKEQSDYIRDAEVSQDELDRFTICFTCNFTRQGLRGAHYIEVLNQVRIVVAHGLTGLGHVVHDDLLKMTPGRSMWARYQEWACLARSNGAHHGVITQSVLIAQASKIAS